MASSETSEKIAEYQALIERIFAPIDLANELTDEQIDKIHERLDEIWESMDNVERVTIETWRKGQRGDA